MSTDIMTNTTQDDKPRPSSPSSSPSSSPTGWTTIHPHSRYTRRFRPGQSNTIINDDSGKKKKKDLSFALALTPRSTTLEILRKDYAKHKADLAASKFWETTKKFISSDLKERSWNWSTTSIDTEKSKNRKVVCLGLGSMSSVVGWRISLDQLAYLELWLQSLLGEDSVTGVVEKYAQDPAFNDLDDVLLGELGYNVVKDPRGFEVIDEDTLVFAPHLDHVFTHKFWLKNPSMAVCNDVMIWGNTMSIQEYCEKYPAFDEVIEKYQKFILPKSNEINNGRAFNDTVVYWSPVSVAIEVALQSKGEQEVVAAGIKVSVTPPSREASPLGDKRETTSVGKDVFVNTVKTPATTKTSVTTTDTTEKNGERIFLSPTAWIPTKELDFVGYSSFHSIIVPKAPPIPSPDDSSRLSGSSTTTREDADKKMPPTPAKGFTPEQMRNRFKNRRFARPSLRRRDDGFHPLQNDMIVEEPDEDAATSPTEALFCHSSLSISLDSPLTPGCGYESSDSLASDESSSASIVFLSPSGPRSDSSVESSPETEKEHFSFSPAFPDPVKDHHREALKSPPFITLDTDFTFSSSSSSSPNITNSRPSLSLSSIISADLPSTPESRRESIANDSVLNEKDQNRQRQNLPTLNHDQGSSSRKSAESISEKPIPVPLMTVMHQRRREEEEVGGKNQISGWEGTSVVEYRNNDGQVQDHGKEEVDNMQEDTPDALDENIEDKEEEWLTIAAPRDPFDESAEADDILSDEDLVDNVAIEDLELIEAAHFIRNLRLHAAAHPQVLDLDESSISYNSVSSHSSHSPDDSLSDEEEIIYHRPQFNPAKDLSTSPIRFAEIEIPPPQPTRRCLLDEDEWDDEEFEYGLTHYDQEDADNTSSYCYGGNDDYAPSSNHDWSFFMQGGNDGFINYGSGVNGVYGGNGRREMYFRGNLAATRFAGLLRGYARGDRGPMGGRWDVR